MKVFLLAGQSNMQGFGKIAGYPVLCDDRIFNQTKEAIASLKNAAFASSRGLICEGLHFDTESIREFGVRYAKAYLDIMKQKRYMNEYYCKSGIDGLINNWRISNDGTRFSSFCG